MDLEDITEATTAQKEEIEQDKKKLEDTEKELLALKEEFESEDSSLAALESDIREDMDAASNPAPVVATTEESSEEDNLTTLAAETDNSDSNSSSSSNSESNDNSSASSSNASSNNSSASSNSGSSKPKSNPKPPKYTGGGGSAISDGATQLGTPYQWGGTTPGGFDCSGFVSWAYGPVGVNLPSQTGALLSKGTSVPASDMQPGDLVFFDTNGTNGHVGIYTGNGQFIGSQSSSGVSYANMTSGYWAKHFNGVVRRIK